MHHDWVFDVLQDMLSYATLNGLPRLAERVAEAMEVAKEEIAALGGPDDPPRTPPGNNRQTH